MAHNIHDDEIPPYLSAVLYALYYVENVEDDNTYSRLLKYYISTHTGKELKNAKEAIDWGLAHRDFTFSDQLPNLRKSNQEIVVFFKKLNEFIISNDKIMELIKQS
jgi:hypothetical protein